MTARSIRYTDDGAIEQIEVQVGPPGPGEVQIEGLACGICSWDIATCRYGSAFSRPAPPGHEGVGRVVVLGDGVEGVRIGDRVAGGGFQSLRNLPAERAYRIPESSRADEHWIVEPVSCAVTGIDHCRLKPGDRVVIIGLGFMGLLILQGLLRSYADTVIGIDTVAARVTLARDLGLEETYDAGATQADEIAAALHPREVDVVVDTTGSQAGLDLATRIVRRGGTINLFGWIKGEQASFDPTEWHLGGFTVVNSAPGSRLRDPFPAAIRLLERGIIDLKPLVTHVVSLDEYPRLMREIVDGEPGYLKGVVTLR